MKKAIFLDRDGTVIVDKHYLSKVDDIEYFPFTFDALRILQELGFELFLVTNQSGIARKYFTVEAMHSVHQAMQAKLQQAGLPPFVDIKYCPHIDEDGCLCRKPLPGMLEELIKEHSIDRKNSFMVGDKISDAECGKAAGIKSILLAPKTHPQWTTYTDIYQFALALKSC